MRWIVIVGAMGAAASVLALGDSHAFAQTAPASPAATVDRQRFSNTWKLNAGESEKLRDKLRQAHAGEHGGGGASGARTIATRTARAMIRAWMMADAAIPPGRSCGSWSGPLIGPGPLSLSADPASSSGSSRPSVTSPRPIAFQMMHPFRSERALNARKESSLYIPDKDFSRP